jgi:hypothetical protein
MTGPNDGDREKTDAASDRAANQSVSDNTTVNRMHNTNASVDGVSLPDMSMSFSHGVERDSIDFMLRTQFDEDSCMDEHDEGTGAGLNPGLDNDIRLYEKAIADYQSLEEDSLAGLGVELTAVLPELRRDPGSFAASASAQIRALARGRANVFSSKAKLGISDHINYDASGRKRSKSFSSPARTDLFSDSGDEHPALPRAPPRAMNKRASWQPGRVAALTATATAAAAGLQPPRAAASGGASGGGRDGMDTSSGGGVADTHTDTLTAEGDDDKDTAGADSSLSQQLSTRWAERLIDVNPTRGKLKEGVDDKGVQTFHIRPRWPEWLVDTNYSVVKKNKYGKRQKRMIKLTEHHFFNVKNGREITQTFLYSEMQNVWLKNQTTLLVSFGEDRIYEYLSEIAPLIAQQLATRVQVRNALDKASSSMLSGEESVANYSKSTAAMIHSIEGGGSASKGPSSVISFARTISETFLNEQECIERGSSMWHRDTDGVVDDAALAQRLIHVLPDSPERLISAAIQDLMFDTKAPEGNTRRVFIEKFLKHDTEGPNAIDSKILCTELRHFIGEAQV